MDSPSSTAQMLTLVLDALPMRVFWKDTESRLLGCNLGFAQDAGVSAPGDLIGGTHFEFYLPDQAQAYRADDLEVMTSGRAKLGFEEQLLLESGETVWVETNKLPLMDAEGVVIGLLATYNDITPRHRATEDLVRRVDELTIARDIAVAAAAAKSRFVENMSHELRAPLQSIIDGAEFVLSDPNGTSARETSAILVSARHLLDLVGGMLAAAQFAADDTQIVNHENTRSVAA